MLLHRTCRTVLPVGLKVKESGFRFSGLGLRVYGVGFRVQMLRIFVRGFKLRAFSSGKDLNSELHSERFKVYD